MLKKLLFIVMLLFGAVVASNAQTKGPNATEVATPETNNAIEHKVAMGETVMLIARKYRVTPRDIYDLNPKAVNGISANMVLTIPSHSLKPKETRRDLDEVRIYMNTNMAPLVAKE